MHRHPTPPSPRTALRRGLAVRAVLLAALVAFFALAAWAGAQDDACVWECRLDEYCSYTTNGCPDCVDWFGGCGGTGDIRPSGSTVLNRWKNFGDSVSEAGGVSSCHMFRPCGNGVLREMHDCFPEQNSFNDVCIAVSANSECTTCEYSGPWETWETTTYICDICPGDGGS